MRLDRVYISLGRAGRLTEAKLSAAATRRTACRSHSGAWPGAGSGDDDGSSGMRRSYRRPKRLVPPDDGLQPELPNRSFQAPEQLRMLDDRRDRHGAFAERGRHGCWRRVDRCASLRSKRATTSRPRGNRSPVSHAKACPTRRSAPDCLSAGAGRMAPKKVFTKFGIRSSDQGI